MLPLSQTLSTTINKPLNTDKTRNNKMAQPTIRIKGPSYKIHLPNGAIFNLVPASDGGFDLTVTLTVLEDFASAVE